MVCSLYELNNVKAIDKSNTYSSSQILCHNKKNRKEPNKILVFTFTRRSRWSVQYGAATEHKTWKINSYSLCPLDRDVRQNMLGVLSYWLPSQPHQNRSYSSWNLCELCSALPVHLPPSSHNVSALFLTAAWHSVKNRRIEQDTAK